MDIILDKEQMEGAEYHGKYWLCSPFSSLIISGYSIVVICNTVIP